jgi:hypothetical protein
VFRGTLEYSEFNYGHTKFSIITEIGRLGKKLVIRNRDSIRKFLKEMARTVGKNARKPNFEADIWIQTER